MCINNSCCICWQGRYDLMVSPRHLLWSNNIVLYSKNQSKHTTDFGIKNISLKIVDVLRKEIWHSNDSNEVSVHFYYLPCWPALFSVCFMTARASPAPVYTIDFLYIWGYNGNVWSFTIFPNYKNINSDKLTHRRGIFKYRDGYSLKGH